MRRRLPAVRGWLVEHRLPLAAGLVASVPIIVSTAEVVAAGWVPYSDDAVVATRAFDVLTSRTPLLGQWSSGYSGVNGEPTYGLGPLLFWFLALPARLPWPGSFEIAAGLLNVASVIGAVGLAHRRGGRPLMFAVAIGIPLMFASLPSEVYSDIWNPSAGVSPLMLVIFLAWSLACGEYRLLPPTVLLGSFVAQCHIGYAIPVVGAVAVGVTGLRLSRRWTDPQEAGSSRPWILAAVIIGLLCFSAPLVEQAIHRPGNLVLLARAALAGEPTVGVDAGWRAVVHTVGVVPWWLRDPQVPIERIADLSVTPSVLTIGSAVFALAALVVVTIVGWRHRRLDVAGAGALGLTLIASLALVTASTPEDAFPTVGYTIRWASPLGMWLWVVLGWSVATLLGPHPRLATTRRPGLAALAGLGAVALVAGVVAVAGELRDEPHDEMRAINERTLSELPPEGPVRVDASSTRDASFMALGLHGGLVYALRRDGHHVTVPFGAAVFGGDYTVDAGDDAPTVRVDVDKPAPRHGLTLMRLPIPEPPDPGDPFAPKTAPVRKVSITLVPAASAR
jgi:hypothetical protein